MPRDDFNKKTIDNLAKRVGVRCSNPSCRKLTTGPRSDSTLIVNIGIGAHITAASSGGPRFDTLMTEAERQHIDNGIWLCQNCAKLIDNDPNRFSSEVLKKWKQIAERAALSELEGKTLQIMPDYSAEIDLTYRKVQIKSERHDYRLEVSVTNRGNEPLDQYHLDVEVPTRVIEKPEIIKNFVAQRSTNQISFFRVGSEKHLHDIFPGDTEIIMTIDYYMDHKIFFNRGNLFKLPVKATMYRRGFLPISIEKPFEDLQYF